MNIEDYPKNDTEALCVSCGAVEKKSTLATDCKCRICRAFPTFPEVFTVYTPADPSRKIKV